MNIDIDRIDNDAITMCMTRTNIIIIIITIYKIIFAFLASLNSIPRVDINFYLLEEATFVRLNENENMIKL